MHWGDGDLSAKDNWVSWPGREISIQQWELVSKPHPVFVQCQRDYL